MKKLLFKKLMNLYRKLIKNVHNDINLNKKNLWDIYRGRYFFLIKFYMVCKNLNNYRIKKYVLKILKLYYFLELNEDNESIKLNDDNRPERPGNILPRDVGAFMARFIWLATSWINDNAINNDTYDSFYNIVNVDPQNIATPLTEVDNTVLCMFVFYLGFIILYHYRPKELRDSEDGDTQKNEETSVDEQDF